MWIFLASIVKKALDRATLIERHDEQACAGNTSSLQDPFSACIAKHNFMAQLLCLAKATQVPLHCDVGNLCGLQNERDEAADAATTASKNVISETLALFTDSRFFRGHLDTMRYAADKLGNLGIALN